MATAASDRAISSSVPPRWTVPASASSGARHGIAVSAVLASQFAAIAALAAALLFRERLGRTGIVGVVVIAAGVAAVSALRAY